MTRGRERQVSVSMIIKLMTVQDLAQFLSWRLRDLTLCVSMKGIWSLALPSPPFAPDTGLLLVLLYKFILFATALKLSLSRSRAQVPENVDTAMFLARAPASPPPKWVAPPPASVSLYPWSQTSARSQSCNTLSQISSHGNAEIFSFKYLIFMSLNTSQTNQSFNHIICLLLCSSLRDFITYSGWLSRVPWSQPQRPPPSRRETSWWRCWWRRRRRIPLPASGATPRWRAAPGSWSSRCSSPAQPRRATRFRGQERAWRSPQPAPSHSLYCWEVLTNTDFSFKCK